VALGKTETNTAKPSTTSLNFFRATPSRSRGMWCVPGIKGELTMEGRDYPLLPTTPGHDNPAFPNRRGCVTKNSLSVGLPVYQCFVTCVSEKPRPLHRFLPTEGDPSGFPPDIPERVFYHIRAKWTFKVFRNNLRFKLTRGMVIH
jgi:hypothetical protein